MRFLSCALFILISDLSVSANLTNLVRETFSGYGTNTASFTGAFNVVSGTFNRRGFGPRLAADISAGSLGWSARMDLGVTSTAFFNITNSNPSATTNGFFGAWFFLQGASTGGNRARIMQLVTSSGVNQMALHVNDSGVISLDSANFTPFNNILVATNAFYNWYFFAFEWVRVSGNNFTVRVLTCTPSNTNLVQIFGGTNVNSGALMGQVGVLNEPNGGTARFSGRIGMPSLYTEAALGDAAYPPEILIPPITPPTWYVNTVSGNDTNSGLIPSESWISAGKINEEAQTAGLLGSTNFANGSTLAIDTSGALLDISHTNLTFDTRGLNIKSTNAPFWTNLTWVTLTNADFSALSGAPNVWQITTAGGFGFGQSNIVVWENDKWMDHPTGPTIASVTNYLATNDGSFWTDGSTIYLHPFGNSNPTSDGKSYTRSVARSTDGVSFAITINSTDMNIGDCVVGKTCMARFTDNDSLGAYCFGSSGIGMGGTSQLAHCYFYYGSKHCLGLVHNSTNSILIISNVTSEQGSPYFSQTPFVSFMASANSSGNTHIYRNCTNLNFQGLIGSADGDSGGSYGDSLYSHNSAGSNQFALIYVDGCNFSGGSISSASSIVFYVITNSIFQGSSGMYGVSNFITRSRVLGAKMPQIGATNLVLIMQHSVIQFTNKVDNSLSSVRLIIGTNDWENCTFDFTPNQSGNLPSGAIVQRSGAVNLLARNNIFRMSQSAGQIFFGLLTNSDSLTLSNNIYLVGTNLFVCQYRNTNCTLATWQAFGFDALSIGTDPRLDAQYNLLGDSRARGFGVDVGPSVDFTGALFGNRRSAGAMEYRTKRSFSP